MIHFRSLCSLLALFAITGLWNAARADHNWGPPYHWARQQNPFTLKLGNNVSSKWTQYLSEASTDWSASVVLDTSIVTGTTDGRKCRAADGRIEVCSAKYGFVGWLGVAQIWVTGGVHIYKATAKMNDSYFDTATYNKPEWRRLVMCQEIAHDFGMDHQDENFSNPNLGTCMDYTNNPLGPPSNEHPNQHDYDQLVSIYGHSDSGTTIGQEVPRGKPAAMDLIDPEGPGQWGRLVRESRDGGIQIYELDFGGGNRIVTHVLWTPDHPRGRGVER